MGAADRAAAGRAILVGDLNIAPLEHDVWSHKALAQRGQPHAGRGREAERALRQRAPGSTRCANSCPTSDKLYTWWSYRSPDWANANKGRRLDHIWVSPALGPAVAAMEVMREARGWDRPSDHVPVKVTLTL